MTKPAPPSGATPDILIVEDSPVEAELLRRVLDRAGYRVTIAQNGAEGLQAARAHRPALIVSDVNMPEMDGYALCRESKHDEALWNVPVILLTVLSEARDIIRAISSGADGYITKPFVEASLLERIRNCIREADTAARLGGDEFVVILDKLNADKARMIPSVQAVAEKIRAALARPYRLQRQLAGDGAIEHCCSTSIGVALFSKDGNPEEILKRADKAMYQAKHDGCNQVRIPDQGEE